MLPVDIVVFFFQAEDGIRDLYVTGVQTCALPISQQVDLSQVQRIIAIGSDRMMNAVREARHGILKQYLKPDHVRSEERRVGKECRSRRTPSHIKKKERTTISLVVGYTIEQGIQSK